MLPHLLKITDFGCSALKIQVYNTERACAHFHWGSYCVFYFQLSRSGSLLVLCLHLILLRCWGHKQVAEFSFILWQPETTWDLDLIIVAGEFTSFSA